MLRFAFTSGRLEQLYFGTEPLAIGLNEGDLVQQVILLAPNLAMAMASFEQLLLKIRASVLQLADIGEGPDLVEEVGLLSLKCLGRRCEGIRKRLNLLDDIVTVTKKHLHLCREAIMCVEEVIERMVNNVLRLLNNLDKGVLTSLQSVCLG